MIKSLPGALLAAVVLAVAGSGLTSASDGFDAGIEYRELTTPERAEPGTDLEVVELFWYGCPHCYHLEPALAAWRAKLPPGVTFRRMPAAGALHWLPHARAYYAALQLGVLDKFHEPLFKAMHEARRKIMSEEELIAFAAESGIDEAAFRAAYESFPVDVQVRRAAEFGQRHQITGVPTLVVNGKYVTSATMTGSADAMFAVVDHLLAKERAAGAPAAAAPTAPPAVPPPAVTPAAPSGS